MNPTTDVGVCLSCATLRDAIGTFIGPPLKLFVLSHGPLLSNVNVQVFHASFESHWCKMGVICR